MIDEAYQDFLKFTREHPDIPVVGMDTVKYSPFIL